MVHESWANVTAALREKGDKSPQWWQEGKQALWSKEKSKQKGRDQQRDGLGIFNQGKASLCHTCAIVKGLRSRNPPHLQTCLFLNIPSASPPSLGLYFPIIVLECLFQFIFLSDSFLFLLLIFLLVLFLLFGISPCNLWSSGSVIPDGQCGKALLTGAS